MILAILLGISVVYSALCVLSGVHHTDAFCCVTSAPCVFLTIGLLLPFSLPFTGRLVPIRAYHLPKGVTGKFYHPPQ